MALQIMVEWTGDGITADAYIDGKRTHGMRQAPLGEFESWVNLVVNEYRAMSGEIVNEDKPCPACGAPGVPLPVSKYRCSNDDDDCRVDTFV